jgi:hypothetical protein
MRHLMRFTLLSFAAIIVGCAVSEADSEKKEKGVEVQIDDLKATTPGEWKEEEPSNKFRSAQFRLPKAKDDKQNGEVVIFKGLGGGVDANVKRWKEQFQPPEGKTIDDVAKVTKVKIGGEEATMLDVTGTYSFKARPFDPQSKAELLPNYRMIAIYYQGKDPYQIKMTGPAKTVEQYKKGFDEWVKAFK